jgi:uncharacterized membrane protein YidH (DUF202 family)
MSERSELHGHGALQRERTALAWTRTVLAATATGALIARTADSGYERGAAVTLAAVGVLLALVTSARRRRTIATGEPVATAPAGMLGGLVAGVAALVIAGVVVVL